MPSIASANSVTADRWRAAHPSVDGGITHSRTGVGLGADIFVRLLDDEDPR